MQTEPQTLSTSQSENALINQPLNQTAAAHNLTTTAAEPVRVLVIDDDPMIRSLLCAILHRAGYQTITAGDGVAALACVSETKVDLIFSDIRMPLMNGPEFYQQLQQLQPQLLDKIIFATSETLSQELRQFFEHTGRPYLRKPFSTADVRRLAAEVCPA